MLHERNNGTGKSPRIESTYSDYPEPIGRAFKNMDLMQSCGAYYFVLGPILTFMILLQELAMEKEMKLRQGLNVVGVSHTTYWAHWIIVGTILNFLQCCVLMLFGFIYGFKLFSNCDFSILFLVFFKFG